MKTICRHGAKWAGAGLMCFLAGGCSVMQKSADISAQARMLAARLQGQHAGFHPASDSKAARHAAQEVDKPWLAGRPQPLAREVTLPQALRADVETAMMFPDRRVDLATLAERVTLATGIAVRVQPDALLPREHFLPRLSGEARSQPPTDAQLFSMPSGFVPLPRVLDLVAARLGLAWRYQDDVIDIFRTETRTFNVRALLLKSSSVASLGRSASGGTGAFDTASTTTVESSAQDVLGAVTARIEPFLTQAGVVAAHGDGSSMIVITDTPQALARVADYIERENRAQTRRVRLVFEEITIALRDSSEAGIDWDLVYAAARTGASFVGAANGSVQEAASVAASVTDGRWSGSRAIIRALGEVGTVVRHTSVPLVTLNRRPVTHAVRTTFSWIDQVQTTAVSTVNDGGTGGALPSVSVSQKQETVGQFLTLVPDAQEDGQVLLSVAYDSTVAQPLTSVTFGSGDNAVRIQQLTVDGSGSVQQVELRPGQPMIVAGFDRRDAQATTRRLDTGTPMLLGGSERASETRETTVVILTALVEDGF
jgi:type IVB pilus formation R64 PilN family outer membrane protein